jgi:hypothetical protein
MAPFKKKPRGWLPKAEEKKDVDVIVSTSNLPEINKVNLYLVKSDSPLWSEFDLVVETNLGSLILNPEVLHIFHSLLSVEDEEDFALFEYSERSSRIDFKPGKEAIDFKPSSVELVRVEGIGLYFSVKSKDEEIHFVFSKEMAPSFRALILNEVGELNLSVFSVVTENTESSTLIDVAATQLQRAMKKTDESLDVLKKDRDAILEKYN